MKTATISKSILAASLALLSCHALHAQPTQSPAPDKVGLSRDIDRSHELIEETPPMAPGKFGLFFAGEATSSSEAKLKGGDTTYRHVAIQNATWALGQNIPFSKNRNLTIGLGYDRTQIDVEGPINWKDDNFWKDYKRDHPNWDRLPLPSRLQSLTASLSYSQKIDEKWSISSSIAVGSHVGKTELLSNGWGTNASLMGLYTWSPDLTFAIGAAYDSISHDYRIMPILGFEWRPAEKWSVAIGFPKTAVSYELNKKVTMSLAASGSGGTYFIKDDPYPGVTSRSLSNSKLEYTEARLGFQTDWKINDTFAVTTSIGQVLYREFKYIDRNNKVRSRDAVPFVSIGGSIAL